MSEEPIRCPKCHSTQIHIDKRGFKTGRAIAGGMITGNVLVAAAAGGVGMNNIELTCLKCGNKFKAGEAYTETSVEHDRRIAEFESHVTTEREKTAMYRCDCGKESCLPISRPICPKCGRRLNENNLFSYQSEQKNKWNGFVITIVFLIFIVAILLLVFMR